MWLEAIKELLNYNHASAKPFACRPARKPTESRHPRQDVNVSIHYRNGNPQVLVGEDELFRQIPVFIGRQLNHAQFGFQSRGLDIPAEIRLRRVRLREFLHLLKRFLVQLDGQPKRLGDGLIRYVIVAKVVSIGHASCERDALT